MQINSIEYWEKRFKEDWQINLGQEQTAFFAKILCNLLPTWLKQEITNNNYSVCDCGCAEGESAVVLAETLHCKVDGFDFAEEAIKQANLKYPQFHFFVQDLNSVSSDCQYDVAICSNVLEHFQNPWPILEQISKIAQKYMLILIPYQESMEIEEHLYRFEANNIFVYQKEFSLVYAASVDGGELENTLYANQQLLLVYQKDVDVNKEQVKLGNFIEHVRSTETHAMHLAYNELQSSKNTLQSAHNELQSSFDALKSSNNTLQSWYDSLQTSFSELQSSNSTLQSWYDSLQTSFSELQSSNSTLQSWYNSLQSSNSTLQSAHNELQSSYQQDKVTLEEIQQKCDQQNKQISTMNADLQAMNQKITESAALVDTLERKLVDEQNHSQAAYAQVQQDQEMLQAANAELAQKLAVITQQTGDLATLQKELQLDEEQMATIQAKAALQEETIKQNNLQIEYLKTHIYTLQIEAEKVSRSISWRITKPLRIVRKFFSFTKIKFKVKRIASSMYHKVKASRFGQRIKRFIPRRLKQACSKRFVESLPLTGLQGNQYPNYEGLEANINKFSEIINNKQEKVLLVFSGVEYVDSEGQRGIRIVHEAVQSGWKVLFCYWRWDVTAPIGKPTESILQIPLDYVRTHYIHLLSSTVHRASKKAMLIEFPHPLALPILNVANSYAWTTIYDVIDDWEEFQKQGQAVWYDVKVEQSIVSLVDINVATAKRLREKLLPNLRQGVDYHVIPNGVDPNRMKPSEKLEEYNFSAGNLQIGYFGHLTDAWFDWQMIYTLAREHTDWTFHLIGYGAPENVLQMNNIKMYGKLPPDEIPKYAAYWDVAIIPFINCELTLGVNPIKIYEYLQLGLPTVASNMPEIEGFPYTELAIGAAAFAQAIQKASALAIDQSVIRQFIEENTWNRRFMHLENSIFNFNPNMTYKCIYNSEEEV